MKRVTLLLAVTFLVFGCSNKARMNFGLTENIPDEYQVKRNKSLEVPPCYCQDFSKVDTKSKGSK